MKNQLNTLMVITFCSAMLLGCSSSSNGGSPYTPPPAVGAPTGIPDQDSFTLSTSTISVEGQNPNVNDVENTISVYVADRHNYAVPDKTVVYFLTDAGAFVTKSCTTTAGACTVTWRSQNPKSANGIVHVIAYTRGEESFLDVNGNDKYDLGETFTDISEPYVDSNENGSYDAGAEQFIDENHNGVWDKPSGIYTGTQCVGDVTVCDRRQLDIWTTRNFYEADGFADGNKIVTTFSPAPQYTTTASGTITFTTPNTQITQGSIVQVKFAVLDNLNNVPMPDGTTIAIKATDGTFDPASITTSAGLSGAVFTYTAPTPTTLPENVIFTVTVTAPAPAATTTVQIPFTIN